MRAVVWLGTLIGDGASNTIFRDGAESQEVQRESSKIKGFRGALYPILAWIVRNRRLSSDGH